MYDFFEHPENVGATECAQALVGISQKYGFARLQSIGRSVRGRALMSLEFGSLRDPALFIGGTHGAEWVSVIALLRFAADMARALSCRGAMYGIDLYEAISRRGAVIVPLLNPDGLETARGSASEPAVKGGRYDAETLLRWQANARGVDLNHNFPAGFREAAAQVRALGIRGPGPTRYGGPFPFSEPETRAVRRLCRMCRFRAVYSLHSQGEEIYWRYGPTPPEGALRTAKILGDLTGYTLSDPPAPASGAGLTDWFIERYARPGFTIELGRGQNPLPYSNMPAIYRRIGRALTVAAVL